MSDSTEPLVQTCPSCGALIDVSDEEPFALMHCPNCGTGMRVRRSFDHFELQEVLGAGGMGAVYRALDTNLNRMVALKLLRKQFSADPEFVRQFEAEAATTASINHTNIVKVYSSGVDHGMLYIAMELVDKGSLDDLMQMQKRVPEMQVLEVGIQIAKGLNAALQRGLIHRDIKPGNILFANAHSAKIVDFGLAALVADAGKVGGEVWGTPYYVAPEKLDNQPEDARSDMYSLGATLFHALAGRPPFEAETASMVALKHVKSQMVSLQAFAPDVSSTTAYVINKVLNKDPEQRYQTYEELIEHLEFARNELISKAGAAKQQAVRVVMESESQGTAMTWITFAIIAVVVLGGVAAFKWRPKPHHEEEGGSATVEQIIAATAEAEPKFKQARADILNAKYKAAAEELGKLDETPNLPQPLRNWITMHQGLAYLFAGKNLDARKTFGKIEERGLFSNDPNDARIAKFFVESAKLLRGEDVIDQSVAKDYDKTNYQAFALLLFGLKNWNMEKPDEATALFRQFTSSWPEAPPLWIGDERQISRYKDIAKSFVTDSTAFKTASEAIKSASSMEEKVAALKSAKEARAEMKLTTKFSKSLDESIAEFEPQVATLLAEKAKMDADNAAADAKNLPEAKKKRADLVAQYKFTEARFAITSASINSDAGKQAQEVLGKKTNWLANFKSILIGDINTFGYPQPVVKKTGPAVPGGIVRADEEKVYVKSQYGFLPVPWTDIAPEQVVVIAQYFIRPTLTPELSAHRKWHLGVFECEFGKMAEGRTLLSDAARTMSVYNDEIPLFAGDK